MKITNRMSQSPLVEYCNFENGVRINLVRIQTPYADGRCYYVHENTNDLNRSAFFKCHKVAKEQYDLTCQYARAFGYVQISCGVTGN